MEIINILITFNGIVEDLESFLIHEEQLSGDVLEVAEQRFIELIKEKEPEINDDDIDEILDNGYYENNGYELQMIVSYGN